MENMSKAIIIAGGVLIAIIVLVLLIIMFNNITDMNKNNFDLTDEIIAFNQTYESYDGKKIYGSELTTLINKVINNNKKYKDTDEYSTYKIDLNIKFVKDITAYEISYTKRANGMGYDTTTKEDTLPIFEEGEIYDIDDLNNKTVGSNNVKFFSTANNKVIKTQKANSDDYTERYTGFADFKRRIFKCTGITYSKDTGRVEKLSFIEIDPN